MHYNANNFPQASEDLIQENEVVPQQIRQRFNDQNQSEATGGAGGTAGTAQASRGRGQPPVSTVGVNNSRSPLFNQLNNKAQQQQTGNANQGSFFRRTS